VQNYIISNLKGQELLCTAVTELMGHLLCTPREGGPSQNLSVLSSQ
jgi:hypothetical protein